MIYVVYKTKDAIVGNSIYYGVVLVVFVVSKSIFILPVILLV